MEIVISIPDEIANDLKNYKGNDVLYCATKYGKPLEKVLEDIRAKIEDEEDFAYANFDEYNEEILGFDDTDICERDLCHIGLSRAIQIIDKHISGKGSRHDTQRSN